MPKATATRFAPPSEPLKDEGSDGGAKQGGLEKLGMARLRPSIALTI